MTELLSYLYGDHVNKQLTKLGSPSLKDLRSNETFVKDLHEYVHDKGLLLFYLMLLSPTHC